MRTRSSLMVAISLALALAASGCTRSDQPSSEEPPNILLITVDTLRRDHLSIYGFQERSTPNIDRLGREGAVFDSAYCDVTWTTPSMATTLTGLQAARHGFRSNFDTLPGEIETVAERLGRRGYHTVAVIGSYPLTSGYGLDQGFDVYDDDLSIVPDPPGSESLEAGPARRSHSEQVESVGKSEPWRVRRSDAEVSDTAIDHLTSIGDTRPFFLWVHYLGPHSLPDMLGSGLKGLRKHIDTYADRVVQSDSEVGRLVDHLTVMGLDSETLVIFHSDHGEALGEHKFIGHGRFLYEDNLRIPLIIRWPGQVPAGRRVAALVGTVDIAATVLDAAGALTRDSSLDGRSMLPAVFDGAPVRTELFLETYLPAHQGFAERTELSSGEPVRVGVRRMGVLRPPFKLVRTQPHPLFDDPDSAVSDAVAARFQSLEFFNLEADPGEVEDLAHLEDEILLELEALLERHLEQATVAPTRADDDPEGHIEKLRSLGYLE